MKNEWKDNLIMDRLVSISQKEHPVLSVPFFTIHPCNTAKILGDMGLRAKNADCSQGRNVNFIVSWLSVYGNLVDLEMDLKYFVP